MYESPRSLRTPAWHWPAWSTLRVRHLGDNFDGLVQNSDISSVLTLWGQVTHICISKLTNIGSNNGLSVASHYLNQYFNIVNWTLRNTVQWNFNRNSYAFIQDVFESVVWKMAAILSRPQCVNNEDTTVMCWTIIKTFSSTMWCVVWWNY